MSCGSVRITKHWAEPQEAVVISFPSPPKSWPAGERALPSEHPRCAAAISRPMGERWAAGGAEPPVANRLWGRVLGSFPGRRRRLRRWRRKRPELCAVPVPLRASGVCLRRGGGGGSPWPAAAVAASGECGSRRDRVVNSLRGPQRPGKEGTRKHFPRSLRSTGVPARSSPRVTPLESRLAWTCRRHPPGSGCPLGARRALT